MIKRLMMAAALCAALALPVPVLAAQQACVTPDDLKASFSEGVDIEITLVGSRVHDFLVAMGNSGDATADVVWVMVKDDQPDKALIVGFAKGCMEGYGVVSRQEAEKAAGFKS